MVVIYREQNCAKIMLNCTIKLFFKISIRRVGNSFRGLFDKIAADNLSFKIILNFCLGNGDFCEPALCRPNGIALTPCLM